MAETLDIKTDEDLEFLSSLESRCHRVQEFEFTPNISGDSFPVYTDIYSDARIAPDEVKKVLDIVSRRNDLFIYPIQGPFGFAPAFSVNFIACSYTGMQSESMRLLQFHSKQLPEGYDFEKLKETFCSPYNLSKASSSGIAFETEKSHYDY